MKGNVTSYETKAGKRWRATFDLPPTIDPKTGEAKRRQTTRRGFKTEKAAWSAVRSELTDLEDGTHVPADRVTVGEWLLSEWLPSIRPRGGAGTGRRHRGTVSHATHDRYTRDLNRYVLPRLGGVKLQALTPAHVDGLYDDLERAGGQGGGPLTAKTVANVAAVLHKTLADAVKRGRLRRNPADAVAPPTPGKASTDWWSVEELRTFLCHVDDNELYAAWLLFATTGAREGEVAALTWDDLDLDAGTMRVDWTLGVVDGALIWKPRPKSKAGERTMALDPATVAALRRRKVVQLEERVASAGAWHDSYTDTHGLTRSGLVWTYGDGTPIRPVTIYRRFVKLAAEAGLPRIRVQDVRHSYASAALASATGWGDVKVISQRLGHANVAITVDRYSHVLPAADEKVAHTLANVILGGS